MIESIRLKNFQSHKKSEIHFEEGLNVIVGTTDSGKTAILRAFSLVVTNRPAGDAMVSHWAKRAGKIEEPMEVELLVDGRLIVRGRKAKNYYKLDGHDFKAVGSDVPDKIRDLLNLDEINVQGQHDSVFLLSDTSGEIAKKLNRVVNLDKMDRAMAAIDSEKRQVSGKRKGEEERVESLEVSIAELGWIDEAEKDVSRYEDLQKQYESVFNQRGKLDLLLADTEVVLKGLEQFEGLDSVSRQVDEAISMKSEKDRLEDQKERLFSVLEGIEAIKIPEFDESIVTDIEEAEQKIRMKKDMEKDLDIVFDLVGTVRSVDRDLRKLDLKIEELEEQWHEEMPDVCPLCGRSG